MIINPDEERIYNIVRKIVRGLYYFEYKEIMPASQDLNCLLIQTQEHFDAATTNELKSGSKSWDGIFKYNHNRTEEGRPSSIWLLNFYNFATFWLIGYDKQYTPPSVAGA